MMALPIMAKTGDYLLKKVTYPIYVGGEVYNDKTLPVLNYEGRTYIPLRSVGDTLGAKVKWNQAEGRVEISLKEVPDTVSGATE